MSSVNPAVTKIVAISGSIRKGSFNRGLIRSAIQICNESIKGVEIEHVDISSLPLINTDLEVDGTFPTPVEEFCKKIASADAFLFVSPEYNYSIAAPLKNALDWGSRGTNFWADRAAAIVSAAGLFGGSLSQHHLRQVGVFLDIHFINKPELSIQAFAPPQKFDSEGDVISEDVKERLKEVILSLQVFTLRLKGVNGEQFI